MVFDIAVVGSVIFGGHVAELVINVVSVDWDDANASDSTFVTLLQPSSGMVDFDPGAVGAVVIILTENKYRFFLFKYILRLYIYSKQ